MVWHGPSAACGSWVVKGIRLDELVTLYILDPRTIPMRSHFTDKETDAR